MKVVYELEADLAQNPERIAKTQAMTLNKEKPLLGLKGTHGLFASDEWWSNLAEGKIPIAEQCGTIERLFFAGQDARWGDEVNSFSMRLADGTLADESIVVNEKSARRLFKAGAQVRVRYALEELKRQPAPGGGVNYARVLLEVAISQDGTAQ